LILGAMSTVMFKPKLPAETSTQEQV